MSVSARPEPRRDAPEGGSRGGWIAPAVDLLGAAAAMALAVVLAGMLGGGQADRAVALAGIAVVLLVMALDPAVGLLVWIAVAPFGRLFNLAMGRGIPDLSLSRVAALFLLFLIIAQVAAGKRKLARFTAIDAAAALFLAGMALSIPASRLGIAGGVQNFFDYVALPLLCFFFARNLLAAAPGMQGRNLHRMAVMLALVGAVIGFAAAREQLTNQPFLSPTPYRAAYGLHSVKVTSIFGSPAIMAISLAVPTPVVFLGLTRARGAAVAAWAAALAAIIAGLLLTYVRAGWLAATVGLVVVIALAPAARKYALLLAPVVLLVAFLLTAGLVDGRAFQERLEAQRPIAYRVQAINVGLEIAARSPILGLGLDNYSEAAIAAGWRPTTARGLPAAAPHNLFIYVLTSAGLVGLIPLVALLGLITWRAFVDWRSAEASGKGWPAALLATVIAYLVVANTMDALGAQYANMVFFLIAGAALGAGRLPAGKGGAA